MLLHTTNHNLYSNRGMKYYRHAKKQSELSKDPGDVPTKGPI